MKIGKEASLKVELKMKQKILYDPLTLISASCWKFSPKMNIRNFKLTVIYISIFLHITWFSIDAFLLSWKNTWPSAIFANNRISQELTTKNIEFLMFSAINYINNKGVFLWFFLWQRIIWFLVFDLYFFEDDFSFFFHCAITYYLRMAKLNFQVFLFPKCN